MDENNEQQTIWTLAREAMAKVEGYDAQYAWMRERLDADANLREAVFPEAIRMGLRRALNDVHDQSRSWVKHNGGNGELPVDFALPKRGGKRLDELTRSVLNTYLINGKPLGDTTVAELKAERERLMSQIHGTTCVVQMLDRIIARATELGRSDKVRTRSFLKGAEADLIVGSIWTPAKVAV